MKKYIVSLVLARRVNNQGDMSIQNEVSVLSAYSPAAAYERSKTLATLKHPDHKVIVKVVVEMEEALAEEIN